MTTETPPLAPLLPDDGRPAWQQIDDLFRRNGARDPLSPLRDEIVTLWSWAHYGEALARRSAASAEPAVAVKALEWLQPMDTFVKGDGIYVTHAYIHEGCVIVFMGTNAKPFGWMDAHAFFKDKVYRDQLLPVALDAPPPSPVVSEAMIDCGMRGWVPGEQDPRKVVTAILNAALSPAPAGEVGWREAFDEMLTALKPFAEQAEHYDEIPGILLVNDDVEVWQDGNYRCPLNAGDLRRARAAISKAQALPASPTGGGQVSRDGASCASCVFHHSVYAECRKSPPVRLPRRFIEPGSRMRDEEVSWGWPSVLDSDWCGEHKGGDKP
jgi:hypothetical protein